MAPTKSIAWKFFQKSSDNSSVRCSLCKQTIVFHKSTTTLMHHLRVKHGEELKKAKEEKQRESIPILPKPGPSMIQPTVKETIENKTPYDQKSVHRQDLDRLVLQMIVEDMQPFSIVEDKGFKKFVKALDARYELPSRTKLAETMLPRIYAEERTKLSNDLKETTSISLTTDIWTSRKTESYLTITAHYINSNWQLCSCILETKRLEGPHTAEYIAQTIREIMALWDISKKVNAIITDNASNMAAAITSLGVRHAGCFAHTLNLVVNNSLSNTQGFEDIKGKVKDIVSFFKHSVKGSDTLRQVQTQAQRPTVLKLTQECPTRWNSCYYMLERYSELHAEVTTALCLLNKQNMCLSNDELDVIKSAIASLRPFEIATREMSGEKFTTASKVIPMVKMLHKALQKVPSTLSTELNKQLRTRFLNAETKFLWAASTLLDPRFMKHAFTDTTALKSIQDGLITRMKPVEDPQMDTSDVVQDQPAAATSELWEEYDAQVATFVSFASQHTVRPQIEMKRHMEEAPIARHLDPLKWWQDRELLCPQLQQLAKRFLSVPATSVPSERLFSKAGELVSHRRTNLKESNINMILFLNKHFDN